MPVIQGSQKPKYLYSTPEGRRYFDESTSTVESGVVFDQSKTAVDYGIENPKVFVVAENPTGNGGTPRIGLYPKEGYLPSK